MEKILDVKLVVWGAAARLCSLRDSTRGQFYMALVHNGYVEGVVGRSMALHPRQNIKDARGHGRTCNSSSICPTDMSPTEIASCATASAEKRTRPAASARPMRRAGARREGAIVAIDQL